MAEVAASLERLPSELSIGTKCSLDSSDLSGSHLKENGHESNLTEETGYVQLLANGYQQSSSDSDSDDTSDVSDNEEVSEPDNTNTQQRNVEDTTLSHWVLNTFVPVCVSLLDHCGDENVIASVVQADLTELSNILQKFCDQHQSGSSAASAAAPLSPASSSSLLKCNTFAFSEHLTPLADGCMSLKVLRSAATSLIPPLLTEISNNYSFTLCSMIVDTVRKLILQVEACVSFLNPDEDLNIYGEIFTDQQKLQLKKFIPPTPPPVYKVHSLSRDVKPAHDRPAVRLSGSNIVPTTMQPISIAELERQCHTVSPMVTKQNKFSYSVGANSKLFSDMTLSTEFDDMFDTEQPMFVRPGKLRRTTISLSHKEVAHLFLDKRRSTSVTVAPNPTALSLPDGTRSTLNLSPILKKKHEAIDDHGERLRKLHQSLLKGFEHQMPSSSDDEILESSTVKNEEAPSTLSIDTVTTTTTSEATASVDTANAEREDCSSRNSTFSSSDSRSSGAYDNSETPKAPSPENVKSPRRHTTPPPSNSAPTTPIRLIKKTMQRVVSHSFEYNAKRSPSRKKSRKSFRPTSTFFDVADLQDENQMMISVELGKKKSSFKEESTKTPFEISVVTNMHQFSQKKFTISRQFRDILQLHDDLISSMFVETGTLPPRPDKKFFKKSTKNEIEEYLQMIISNSELKKHPRVIDFFQPDGNADSPAQPSGWEHKFTFFTPDRYSTDQNSLPAPADIIPQESDMLNFDMRTRSLARRRATTIIKQEEEEVDCNTRIVQEDGQDVLVVKLSNNGCMVIGGTFEKLVEQLACEEKPDPKYVSTFLFGYRHLATPLEFAKKLHERFEFTLAPDASQEDQAYVEKWKYIIQLRVVDILTIWVTRCWPDFYRNPGVMDVLNKFIKQLIASEDSNFKSAGENLDTVVTGNLRNSLKLDCVDVPSGVEAPDGKLLDLDAITSSQLARHLTMVELSLFKAVDLYEMTVHLWEGNSSKTKQFRRNLDAYIQRFNDIYSWVCVQLMDVTLDCKERAGRIEKFIEVAKYCYRMGNFNTLVAIISGLTCAAVRRLHKTWELVKDKPVSCLKKMYNLPDPSENYAYYRSVVRKQIKKSSNCIPMFAVIMKDFTFLHDGIPKQLGNGLFNFKKLRDIVDKLEELKRYQNSKYSFQTDDRILFYCQHSITEAKSEEELFQMSMSIELSSN